MDKTTLLKNLITSRFANLVFLAQRGYPLKGYDRIKSAMESVTFIANYTDPSSMNYLPTYRVETILDYHIRELNQL